MPSSIWRGAKGTATLLLAACAGAPAAAPPRGLAPMGRPADGRALVAATDGAQIGKLPAAGKALDLEVTHPGTGVGAKVATGRRTAAAANADMLADAAALDRRAPPHGFVGDPAAIPPAVDLRPAMPPVRFQGARPVCELMAVCGALAYHFGAEPGSVVQDPSPQFLWWNYQRVVESQLRPSEVWGDTGTDGHHLAMVLRRGGNAAGPFAPPEQGVIDEALAPFDPDLPFDAADDDPAAIARRHLGATADRIARGEALPARGATAVFLQLDLPTLRHALAERRPIVIGLPVLERAWEHVSATADLLPELAPEQAAETDGHAVLLVGYADDPALPGGGAFVLRNSWGTAWGAGGYARVSYQMVLDWADDPYVLDPDPAPFAGRYEVRFPATR